MESKIVIQPCNMEHLNRYGEIYAAAFSREPWNDPWKSEDAAIHIKELLETKTSYGLEYVIDGKVAGFILGTSMLFHYGRTFDLNDLAVDPAYQKRGIAKQLMDKLLSDEEYRKRKESVLATTVFSQKQAIELRKRILETHTSGIELTFEEFDTTKFRQEYIDRLDYRTVRNSAIARKQNICLISHFPHVFADELKCKLTKKIKAY